MKPAASIPAARPALAFWPHTQDPNVASTRIRCLQVVRGLCAAGHDARVFEAAAAPGEGVRAPDVLVLAKRYDEASVAQAVEMRSRHGTRLVLDLCDNHFFYSEPKPQWVRRAAVLRDAVQRVDHVVAASNALADVVRREAAGATLVSVIGDSLDGAAQQSAASATQLWESLRLRWFLATHAVARGRRLLWFGNHGSSYADGGMQDLALIADALHAHHRNEPLTLTIVSNGDAAYARCVAGWTLPTHYVPWSGRLFRQALASHAVAVIPAQLNPFTACKTNNRLATAFCHGLAVAADRIPSYEEFADLAVLGDWQHGLAALMADASTRRQRIVAATARLQERYDVDRISAQWADLVADVIARPAVTRPPSNAEAQAAALATR